MHASHDFEKQEETVCLVDSKKLCNGRLLNYLLTPLDRRINLVAVQHKNIVIPLAFFRGFNPTSTQHSSSAIRACLNRSNKTLRLHVKLYNCSTNN